MQGQEQTIYINQGAGQSESQFSARNNFTSNSLQVNTTLPLFNAIMAQVGNFLSA